MKKHIPFLVLLFISGFIFGQTSISGVININTAVDSINYCSNTIYVESSTGYSVGDRVLIIQMKGATVNLTNTASFGNITSYNESGNYEFGTIANVSGTAIHLENTLLRTYNPSGLVQLVRVPVYASASVDGTLSCAPWNGATGGVLVFETNSLVLNANIDVSNMGFKGGDAGNFPESCPTGLGSSLYFSDTLSGKGGEKGESIVVLTNAYLACRGKAANGGGGGNDHNAGAAGGSNGAAGGLGGENDESAFSCPGSPGFAGVLLDQTMATDKIFLGGGGGAGHGNNNNGTDGGNGGGIVIIHANSIDGNNFSIISNGELVPDLAWGDGAGGGGAGGSILIDANTVIETSLIAKGGKGGDAGAPQCTGPGGGGSGGVIKHSGAAIWPGVSTDLTGGIYGTLTTIGSPCLGENNGATTGGTGVIISSLQYAESITPHVSEFANAGADINICAGNSVVLNASGGVSYSWFPTTYLSDPFISNPTCTPLTNINYLLTVTNANGCIDTDTLHVEVFPEVIANAGDDINVCAGASTILNATGGIIYNWSPALFLDNAFIANPECTPLFPITYTVTVTDANGCFAADEISVGIIPSDFLSVSDDIDICSGGTVELFASGGTTYNWSPSTYLDDATSATPLCNPLSDITYTVTSINDEGCTDIEYVTITTTAVDFLVLSDDISVCSGESATLSASGGTSYVWSPATYLDDAFSANPICTALTDISYTVTSINADGCSDEDIINVIVAVGDFATASPETTICVGTSTDLFASGGTSYSWSPSLYLDDATSSTPTCTPLSDITYYVSVTNISGCVDVDTVVVSVYPAFTVTAGPDTTMCYGGQFKLYVTEGESYLWTPSTYLDNPTIDAPTCNPSVSIEYIVYVTDINGCVGSDTVSVIVNPTPTIIASDDISICRGDTITLSVSGGVSYTWMPTPVPGCGTCDSIDVSPGETTNYVVQGVDANGCIGSDMVLVTVDICNAIENTLAQQIHIYPNPASNYLNIKLPDELINADIILYNILGEIIPIQMERNNSGLININVNHLESQQVILHIISERGDFVKQVMVMNVK
ncbi:MAG: T9SS type A sorting domain-containing protein [Chitinophagales bacterium]|nr:T9SS type A sorting domain-containing protein [Chitinophagales bacterium]